MTSTVRQHYHTAAVAAASECTVQFSIGAELWGSGATTAPSPDGNKKHLSTRPHIHTRTDTAGAQAHTRKHSHIHPLYTRTAWISASRLPFSLPPHIISVALGNVCSVDDDDKAMLLLLEISHPALFTDRCHGIMATLNCLHLVKRIEAWWRFYLSCLCSSCWPINMLKADWSIIHFYVFYTC